EDEGVGFLRIGVLRQALVGLASERRQSERPAKAKRSVAGAGVIGEGKLWAESGATRTGVDGHGQRTGAGHRIRRELLADAADCPASLGERDLRSCYGKWLF